VPAVSTRARLGRVGRAALLPPCRHLQHRRRWRGVGYRDPDLAALRTPPPQWQRALLAAARRAWEACQARGDPRHGDEPTIRLPTDVAMAGGGTARLRLCSACRLHAQDAAAFFGAIMQTSAP